MKYTVLWRRRREVRSQNYLASLEAVSLVPRTELASSPIQVLTQTKQLAFSCVSKTLRLFWETQAGVEPANGGFANRSVRPLRHCVIHFNSKVFTF